MEGIVTFTVAIDTIDADTRGKLDEAVVALGLKATLPETEGGTLHLPAGTYGDIIQIDDQRAQLKRYYRGLVDVMRKLNIKGRYFVNVSQSPAYVCGEL